MLKTKLRIIALRLGRRQEDDLALRMQPGLRQPDQLPSDSLLLVGRIHGQIGKITAVAEIRQRPGNSHQLLTIPGRAYEIGVGQHVSNALPVFHWTPLAQR